MLSVATVEDNQFLQQMQTPDMSMPDEKQNPLFAIFLSKSSVSFIYITNPPPWSDICQFLKVTIMEEGGGEEMYLKD